MGCKKKPRCKKRRKTCRKKPKRRCIRARCCIMKIRKVTPNPFFNFLRVYAMKHCGWSAAKIAVEGARKWCSMSSSQKAKFRRQACQAPKYSKKRLCIPLVQCLPKKKRKTCRKKKRRCVKRKKPCGRFCPRSR